MEQGKVCPLLVTWAGEGEAKRVAGEGFCSSSPRCDDVVVRVMLTYDMLCDVRMLVLSAACHAGL